MKKLLGLFLSVILLFSTVFVVSAQDSSEVPEREGDYPVIGRPGIRVRVFVHAPKQKAVSSQTLAVCSNPSSEAVVGATGWKLPLTTVKYKINPFSVPSAVGGSNLAQMVSSAFTSWTSAINTSAPTLVLDGTTSKTRNSFDGQNIITWGRTQGGALGVTYVWYSTLSHEVVEVDTIMNQKFAWSMACSSTSYNAQDILVHELGHWFGLDDEYGASFVDNTMYGYGSKGETKKITPENGDKAGINLIY